MAPISVGIADSERSKRKECPSGLTEIKPALVRHIGDASSNSIPSPDGEGNHFSKRLLGAADGQQFEYFPLRLLVMQAASSCNINCTYCYLPDRKTRRRMSPGTVDAVYDDLAKAEFVGQEFTTIWHAGEPLTAPLPFYAAAVRSSERLRSRGIEVRHALQTNATLLNDDWCEFFRRSAFRIGVSLDGPADIHDASRTNWAGKGTHAKVMRGISLLQRHDIDFSVICVLTRRALDSPDSLFEFFLASGIRRIGFNFEEIEGVNSRSSINTAESLVLARSFLQRFHDLASREGMEIREFSSLRRYIYSGRHGRVSMQCLPFGIVSVDANGNYSTFSPELLGSPHSSYGTFTFGNIHERPFLSMLDSVSFRRVNGEIQSGVNRCRANCEYFQLCGAGAPSNKVYENGTFDSTETMHCRVSKQAVIDVAIAAVENELRLPASRESSY